MKKSKKSCKKSPDSVEKSKISQKLLKIKNIYIYIDIYIYKLQKQNGLDVEKKSCRVFNSGSVLGEHILESDPRPLVLNHL